MAKDTREMVCGPCSLDVHDDCHRHDGDECGCADTPTCGAALRVFSGSGWTEARVSNGPGQPTGPAAGGHG